MSASSWTRICCSSSRRAGPGSSPSSSREQPSRPSERVEGVCLAPGAVKREPELGVEPLVERMLGDQQLELPDEIGMTAERELRVDEILVRREPVAEKMRQLDRREEVEFAPCERRALPQSERCSELLDALEIVARRPRLVRESREPAQVDLLRRDGEEVTLRAP